MMDGVAVHGVAMLDVSVSQGAAVRAIHVCGPLMALRKLASCSLTSFAASI
jgi:hypothetical protein